MELLQGGGVGGEAEILDDVAADEVAFGEAARGNGRGSLMGWDEVPSPSANYGVARDDIRKRVEKLVAELAAQR